jgi:error-prone DNA polymerase
VCRSERLFTDVADLASRALLRQGDLNLLSASDALKMLAGNRRQAAWLSSVSAVKQGDLFDGQLPSESPTQLPAPTLGENLVADFRQLGHSLREALINSSPLEASAKFFGFVASNRRF